MSIDNPYAPPSANVESTRQHKGAQPTSDALVYGGFWRRFGAFWVDAICLLPLAGINYLLSQQFRLSNLYWLLPGLLIGVWFHVYLVVRYGGTPGKLLLKTRITMLDGSAVTSRAALLRHAVTFALTLLTSAALAMAANHMTDEAYFSLGYIARSQALVSYAPAWYKWLALAMQAWILSEFIVMMLNKRRRALQDFMAGTVVIRVGVDD